MKELTPNELWSWKAFENFRQDTQTYVENEGESNEIVYPPTFAWIDMIKGQRRKDGVYFYQRVRIPGKEDEPLDVTIVPSVLELGLKLFDDYATCECTLALPCQKHTGADYFLP